MWQPPLGDLMLCFTCTALSRDVALAALVLGPIPCKPSTFAVVMVVVAIPCYEGVWRHDVKR